MIKYKFCILIICAFWGCQKKNIGEVTFKNCSGKVVMDYEREVDFNDGPQGFLNIEIFNDTDKDTVFTPIYDTSSRAPDENSSFKLVVDLDSLHLSGRRFTIGKQGYGNNYELILYFKEIEEDSRPDYITDSTYYKNKLIRCLEKGEVIFTDYRSKKIAHIPKAPGFKIVTDWQPYPVNSH